MFNRVFWIMMLFVPVANAGLLLDQSMVYLSNSVKTSGTESTSHYHGSLSISSSMSKSIFLGWKTTLYGQSIKVTAGESKISGLELGPRVGFYLGKARWTSLSFAYLPVHTATYTSAAGVESNLSGTGYELELAFHPDVFANLSPGFSLLYHFGSYGKSTDSSNVTSDVSYSRNGIYPSVYLHWKFGED